MFLRGLTMGLKFLFPRMSGWGGKKKLERKDVIITHLSDGGYIITTQRKLTEEEIKTVSKWADLEVKYEQSAKRIARAGIAPRLPRPYKKYLNGDNKLNEHLSMPPKTKQYEWKVTFETSDGLQTSYRVTAPTILMAEKKAREKHKKEAPWGMPIRLREIGMVNPEDTAVDCANNVRLVEALKGLKGERLDGPLEPVKIQDSGERREFHTGAVRDIQRGKGRFDLVPPEATRAFALHMEDGEAKYGERNWEKGIPLHSFLDSAERHLNDFKEGKADEDHVRAFFWNAGCFIATRERIDRGELPESLDDTPYGRWNDRGEKAV